MSTDADHDWLDKSVDAPTVPVGCHRSHPHENMDSTCERFTQYERENASLRGELTTRERLYKEQWQRAEQAEARALEYKTEHAALLGTSQWQETEIADLRDDVKRHMQIASECEERALANEKAIDALHIAICQASLALSNGELPYDANAILRQALVDYADAAIGAKNG